MKILKFIYQLLGKILGEDKPPTKIIQEEKTIICGDNNIINIKTDHK